MAGLEGDFSKAQKLQQEVDQASGNPTQELRGNRK
jgi:hypothetical protein